MIKLVDGRTVVLSNYFNEAAGDVNHLYLSTDCLLYTSRCV